MPATITRYFIRSHGRFLAKSPWFGEPDAWIALDRYYEGPSTGGYVRLFEAQEAAHAVAKRLNRKSGTPCAVVGSFEVSL